MNPIFNSIFENEDSIHAEKGFNNDVLFEPSNNPPWLKSNSETVYKGANNTFIVLGRDRPGLLTSGYGGKGHMKCGAIDIVAGRLSAVDATTLNGKKVGNSSSGDAARVYISQKTDVDTNFRIPDGRSGNSKALSAIAIKADNIRVMARNTMKLVTGVDVFFSNNERRMEKTGVQLICDDNTLEQDMQPIPKGANLSKALEGICDMILELNGVVQGFMEIQKNFNSVLANHVHHLNPLEFPYVTIFGTDGKFPAVKNTLPVAGKQAEIKMYLKVEQGLINQSSNIASWKSKFTTASSNTYINSKYHYLN
jgi:hypothetical protein